MRKFKLVLFIMVSSIFVSTAFADDTRLALAKEYLELSKTKEVFDITIDTYVNQLSSNDPGINKDHLRAFFNSYMGWEVLKEQTTKIVANTFTVEELKAINDFYKTKYGVVCANKSPALSAAISELIGANLNKAIANMKKTGDSYTGTQAPSPLTTGTQAPSSFTNDLAFREHMVKRINKRFGVALDPKTYSGSDLLEIESLFKCKKSDESFDMVLKMFPKYH
jgi:hypothetical protein